MQLDPQVGAGPSIRLTRNLSRTRISAIGRWQLWSVCGHCDASDRPASDDRINSAMADGARQADGQLTKLSGSAEFQVPAPDSARGAVDLMPRRRAAAFQFCKGNVSSTHEQLHYFADRWHTNMRFGATIKLGDAFPRSRMLCVCGGVGARKRVY